MTYFSFDSRDEVSATRLERVRRLLKENKLSIVYLFILNVLLLIPATLAPIFQKVYTDDILLNNMHEWLFTLIAVMLGVAVFSAVITWLKQYCLLQISNRIEILGEGQYFWKLLHSPIAHFVHSNGYALLSKASAFQSVSRMLTMELLSLLFHVINALVYLYFMLRLDTWMTAVVVALVVMSYLTGKLEAKLQRSILAKRAVAGDAPSLSLLNDMDDKISSDGLTNIEIIKSNASESLFFQRLMNVKTAKVNARRDADYKAAYAPFNTIYSTLFLSLLLFISALRIMDRSFSVGAYLAFQAYAVAFFGPMNQILSIRTTFKGYENTLKNLDGLVAAEPDGYAGAVVSGKKLEGAVCFRDVSFSYDEGHPAIDHLNLDLRPGQRIAIIGKSGAGKTTVLKLLQGLYRPDAGEITIDGIPVDALDEHVFATSVGSANQEISIFSASVRDNITLWDESVSDAEIYRAASDACIHEYITSLEGAYEYELNENGGNLSGGQRQRLEIARALLYNPSVLLMDEATSSLDPKTTAKIHARIARRGCTLINVTHKLEHARRYDEIIVLRDGAVVARGSHNELLKTSEYYARVYQSESLVHS